MADIVKGSFYAVAHGGKRGIYQDWAVCEKWIFKFPGAKYKSFSTAKDAQTYLNENPPQQLTTAQEQWRAVVQIPPRLMPTSDATSSGRTETTVVPRRGVLLTDVLCLVAFCGFEDHVALGGCALNRHTWNDPVLWRAIINVKFELKGRSMVWDATLGYKDTFGLKTRLMIYIEKKSLPWVERALSFGAAVNCSIVAPSPTDLTSPRFNTSPIVLAVESASMLGDRELALSFVALLLDRGADVNQGKVPERRNHHYEQADLAINLRRETITPLEIAASLGFVDMMRLLVTGSKGSLCIPGVNSDDFCRPLQIAIELHHLNCARFLLNQGVKVNYSFVEAEAAAGAGEQPVEDVFRSYLIEIFSPPERKVESSHQAERNAFARIMLQRGAVTSYIEYPTDTDVTTPLHVTMSTGNLAAFKMLLEEFNCDPNPNMLDGYRPSVLLEAARDLKIAYAAVLVRANANVNAAIHFAPDNAWDQDDQWMEKQDWTALHFFSAANCQEGISLVIDAGAEIDAQTFMGYTPLLLCAKGYRGHYYGTGSNQQTALKAREAADVACCELLLVRGSNASHERNWGIMGFLDGDDEDDEGEARAELNYTAATYAVLRNAPALLSLLCIHGADIRQVPGDGYTLIMRAVEKVSVGCLAVLLMAAKLLPAPERQLWLDLQFGADDDDDDDDDDGDLHAKDGQTALSLCLYGNSDDSRSQMFGMLLQAGASYKTVDNNGQGPQQLAVTWNRYQCLALLLDYRFSLNDPTCRKDFHCFFSRAIRRGQLAMAKALLRTTIFVTDGKALVGAHYKPPPMLRIGGSIEVPSSVKLTALQFVACTHTPLSGQLMDELCQHLPSGSINGPCSFEVVRSFEVPGKCAVRGNLRVDFDTLALVVEKCPTRVMALMQKGASFVTNYAFNAHSSLLLALRDTATNAGLLNTIAQTWPPQLALAVVLLCLRGKDYDSLEGVLSRVSENHDAFLNSGTSQMFPDMVQYRELLYGVASRGLASTCRLLVSDCPGRGHLALDCVEGASDSVLIGALRHGHASATKELVRKASVAQLNLVLHLPSTVGSFIEVVDKRGFVHTVKWTHTNSVRLCLTLPVGLQEHIMKFMGQPFDLSSAESRRDDHACWVLQIREPVLCPLLYALSDSLHDVALQMIAAGARLVELNILEAFCACARLCPDGRLFDVLLAAMLADLDADGHQDPQWSRLNCISCLHLLTVMKDT